MITEEEKAVLQELQQIVETYSKGYGIDVFMVGAISERISSKGIGQECLLCVNRVSEYIVGALAGIIRNDPKVGEILVASLAKAGVQIAGFCLSNN